MCHGAGGMAGHVKFGGAAVMLGTLLTGLALFFGNSMMTICRLFPARCWG